MSLFDYDSFRDAVRATRVQPRRYDARTDAHRAVDALGDIERCGDYILTLVREDRVSHVEAERLLQRLLACFASPLETTLDLHRVQEELGRFTK